MNTYAVLDNGLILNVVECDDSAYASDQGWVLISTDPGGPGIGWTTPDGGQSWVAPIETDGE